MVTATTLRTWTVERGLATIQIIVQVRLQPPLQLLLLVLTRCLMGRVVFPPGLPSIIQTQRSVQITGCV